MTPEDQHRADFEKIQGPYPTSSGTGLTGAHITAAVNQWNQDFGLFMGLEDNPPAEIRQQLEDGQGLWDRYGMGTWQCYRMKIRGKPDALCVSFVQTRMPPHQSFPGIFRKQFEDIERPGVINTTIWITEFQQWLIDAGKCLNDLHPAHGIPTVNQNAANCAGTETA